MPFRRRMRRPGSRRRRIYLWLLFVLLFVLTLYVVFNIKLMPLLKTAASVRAKAVAISTINNAVGRVLQEDGISYDKLVSFEKDGDGHITAVKIDSLQLNLLKYDITNEVVNELSNVNASNLDIPLGTVVGGQLLTGRGPKLRIKFAPVGNVNSKISNSFTAAGINQTRQQIMLNIDADISVLVSSYIVSTHVENSICIAESVIVGSVPGTYFNGADETARNAYFYGNAQK